MLIDMIVHSKVTVRTSEPICTGTFVVSTVFDSRDKMEVRSEYKYISYIIETTRTFGSYNGDLKKYFNYHTGNSFGLEFELATSTMFLPLRFDKAADDDGNCGCDVEITFLFLQYTSIITFDLSF